MYRSMMRVVAAGVVAAGAFVVPAAQSVPAQTGPAGYTMHALIRGFPACELLEIDLPTGVATAVSGDEVPCADGLTFSPDGTLYAYRNAPEAGGGLPAELVTIDTASGAQAVVGELPSVFVGLGGMTFDAAGNLFLYATESAGGVPECPDFTACLWQVDPSDASTTFVGAPGEEGLGVFGLGGDCEQVLAITSNIPNGPVAGTSIEQVDTATGALNLLSNPDVSFPSGLDFDADGGLWATSHVATDGFGATAVNQIDPDTGTSSEIAVTMGGDPVAGQLFGLAITGISCPEPPPPAPDVIVVTPTFTG